MGLLLRLRSSDQNGEWMRWHGTSLRTLNKCMQYFESFAEKYDLDKYVKLNSRVSSATWDEAKGIYNVKIISEGKEINDWCHVLVNGTGFLNDWKWPK
jgi:cation diffusion facilitator CzcD-associated flavoprotein CzcO